MKKIVSLILVVAIVFSFTGTAMAKSNSASDQHTLALRVMKSEATRLAGKTFTGTANLLFPITDNPNGAKQMETVTQKAMFISKLLIKAGAISSPLTSNRLWKATSKIGIVKDGALLFVIRNNAVSNVAIYLGGFQYYVGSRNIVVREKYNKSGWNYIGMFPGI
jgi:hypothetical protein